MSEELYLSSYVNGTFLEDWLWWTRAASGSDEGSCEHRVVTEEKRTKNNCRVQSASDTFKAWVTRTDLLDV